LGKVVVEVKVPVDACIILDPDICSVLSSQEYEQYCDDSLLAGTKCIMTKDGLESAATVKNTR
jgi:hypothetical protein